jgi:hypothetical protein
MLPVGAVLASVVLALPLEEVRCEEVVAVLKILSLSTLVEGGQQAEVLR